MSRSPLSPTGKRLRTMNESDNTDDTDDDHVSLESSNNDRQSQQSRKKFSLFSWSCCDRNQVIEASLHLGSDLPADNDADGNNDDDDGEDEDDDEDVVDVDDGNDSGNTDQFTNVLSRFIHIEDYSESSEESFSDDGIIPHSPNINDEYYEISDFENSVQREYYGIDPDDYDSDAEFTGYDTEDDSTIDNSLPDEYLKHDPTPDSQYPKPEWITVNELRQRRVGLSTNKLSNKSTNMYWFEKNVNNSLWMIQRLELSKRLEEHTGCINCLGFNTEGNLLCSGSDDLTVCIWDWQLSRLKKKINTGHQHNIRHSQFCNQDSNIITSSRDGTVRLVDIETGLSELLLSQSGEIGRVAFLTPQTLVTCGTNAYVSFIDLRSRDPTKLFIVRNPRNNRSCALHTINAHPLDQHRIVVAGESPYVFLYDLRRVARNPHDSDHKPTYCIDNNLERTNNIVTSTAFNSIGDKLLISYNDDDLFVCRTDTCKAIHRYTGHRNKKTIKGCSWFGENFVLSGSDDGHIYGWDLESEHIVCFLEGDSRGVVNNLSVHPRLPILASSGLDHNVKVWEPTSKTWPQTLKGIKPQICKNNMRRKRARGRNSRFQALRINAGEATEDDPWFEGVVWAEIV